MSSTSTVPSGILFDGVTIQNFRRKTRGLGSRRLPARDGGQRDHDPQLALRELRGVRHPLHGVPRADALEHPDREQLLPLLRHRVLLGAARRRPRRGLPQRDHPQQLGRPGHDGRDEQHGLQRRLLQQRRAGHRRLHRNGVTADYNVLFEASAKCGAHDLLAGSGFVGGGDLHLLPGAPAINTGLASQAPATDIDGQPRPLGPGPDIGADEAG